MLKLCFRAYFPFALTHSSHSARINITLAKIFDGDRLLAACVHLFHSKNKETCLQKGMIPTQKVCKCFFFIFWIQYLFRINVQNIFLKVNYFLQLNHPQTWEVHVNKQYVILSWREKATKNQWYVDIVSTTYHSSIYSTFCHIWRTSQKLVSAKHERKTWLIFEHRSSEPLTLLMNALQAALVIILPTSGAYAKRRRPARRTVGGSPRGWRWLAENGRD